MITGDAAKTLFDVVFVLLCAVAVSVIAVFIYKIWRDNKRNEIAKIARHLRRGGRK